MFFQALLFDNLLQMNLSTIFDTTSTSFVLLSILEYMFRIYIIGLFLPLYAFLKKTKFSFVKYFSWVFVLVTGRNNILDQLFYKNFSFYPFQLILGVWYVLMLIYLFWKDDINKFVQPNHVDNIEPLQENIVNEESESSDNESSMEIPKEDTDSEKDSETSDNKSPIEIPECSDNTPENDITNKKDV